MSLEEIQESLIVADSVDLEFNISSLVSICHDTAKEKGWWEPAKSFGEQAVLFHAEISEAVEEFRNGHAPYEIYYKEGKPEGVPIELADVIIRIFDTCGYYGIDIRKAIIEKMRYNLTRSHRHGNKII